MAERYMVPDWMRTTINLLPDQLDGRFDQCVIALAVALTTDPPGEVDYDRAGVEQAPNLDQNTYGPLMLMGENIAAAVALSECLKSSHFSVCWQHHETRAAGDDSEEGRRKRAEAILNQHFAVIRRFVDMMATYAGYELAMQNQLLLGEQPDDHTKLSIHALHKAVEMWTTHARQNVKLNVKGDADESGME